MNLPIIYTDRLILRPLSLDDANDMFEYAKLPNVGPNAGWEPHRSVYETTAVIYNLIANKPHDQLGNWAIVDRTNNKMIGTIELHHYFPNFKAELGYSLNPKYWGQGIVTEAAFAVLDYGFNKLELKRIEAGTFIDNFQSQRICEKIGMKKEGVARNGYIRYDGVIFDKVMFGITNDEFEEHLRKIYN